MNTPIKKVPLNYDVPTILTNEEDKLYKMVAKLKHDPTFYNPELMAFPYHKINLNETIRQFLQSELLDVPLKVHQLKDICIITEARGISNDVIPYNFGNRKYPYIQVTDFGGLSPKAITEYVNKVSIIPDTHVDDLIIVISGDTFEDNYIGCIGDVNIAYDEYLLSEKIAVIEIKDNSIIPEYLLLALKARLPEVINSIVSEVYLTKAIDNQNGTLKVIDLDKLLTTEVYLPAKEIQLKVACEWKEYLYLLGKYRNLI
jgi:restriction endonuclease S subunit